LAATGAAEALVALGGSTAPLIASLDGTHDIEVRKQAARALGKAGDPRAIDALAECLKDKDDNLRCYAMQSLVQLGEPARDQVLSLLNERKAKKALSDAIRFCELRGNPHTLAMVWSAIKRYYGTGTEVLSFIELLVEMGDSRGRQLLVAAQRGDSHKVQLMIHGSR
jgi:HEAT repeat protein